MSSRTVRHPIRTPAGRVDRWRWNLKTALATAIAGARDRGLWPLAPRAARALVVGYHRVVEHFDDASRSDMPSMLTSVAMFERHLDCIGRHFRFVTLDEIGEHVAEGRPFDRPVAAVTFDDGYRDVYELALPVLKRKGIPAAMFVVTDLVGKPVWQVHDRLYHLMRKALAVWRDPREELAGLLRSLGRPGADLARKRSTTRTPLETVSALLPRLRYTDVRRLMDRLEAVVGNGFHRVPLAAGWDELAEMQRAGFTIGSHTRRHVSLPAEDPDVIRDELEASRRQIELALGGPVRHFAYPGGQFTPPVVDAVGRAGYAFAYTACPHGDARQPALTIERLLLWERSSVDADGRFSPAILSCQMHGLWPPARQCARVHRQPPARHALDG
ncbi:MAG TPA: polysaccharide deacetylase family protein [Vicinamibacterales bacterium]|nr:polysaccharide deacetylase family protein [Vicinamibacterales bacterium]